MDLEDKFLGKRPAQFSLSLWTPQYCRGLPWGRSGSVSLSARGQSTLPMAYKQPCLFWLVRVQTYNQLFSRTESQEQESCDIQEERGVSCFPG